MARRSKEEKENTALRPCVSAVIFLKYGEIFTQRRKGVMLLVHHAGINLRGKGSLRDQYKTRMERIVGWTGCLC